MNVEQIGAEAPCGGPLLTAVIPCYNMERFITRTLNSVENQAGSVEVVVVNDCSTDRSDEMIRLWAMQATIPCTLVTHHQNRGLPASLNSGLAEATGEYLNFLDADDRWEPGLYSRHIGLLEELGDDYGAIYGDARVENVEGELDRESFIDYFRPGTRPVGDIFEELLYRQNFMHVSAVTVRRKILREVGNFDERLRFQDYDMWLRIASGSKFAYSDSIDAVITSVPGSMSKTIGNDLARGYLISWSKWRDDPRVDRSRLRGLSANAVFLLAGSRAFGLRSAAGAVKEGVDLYGDPKLIATSGYLLGRVAVSRARNRVRRGHSRSSVSSRRESS